jgi:hypothetical protein
MKEAEAAVNVLGESLSFFELGNEIDHYMLVPLASILLCVPTRFTPAFGDVVIDLIAQLEEGEAALSSSGICRSSMGPGSAGRGRRF